MNTSIPPSSSEHDVKHGSFDAAGIEQGENVGMLQFGGGFDLPQELPDPDAHREFVMHDFDRDLAIVTPSWARYTSAMPPAPIFRSMV
jgi:hypothetical protein